MTSADVDAALRAAWHEAGITPSARAYDATFLRRAYLDVVGRLPPPEKVTAFLADTSTDKRAKLVDALLASPEYAEHWTAFWDDVLLGHTRAADIDRQAFRAWLHDQFARNVPWDKVVYALITATGQNSLGGKFVKPLQQAHHELDTGRVDGAVNYVLKYRDTPQDFAGSASKTFLGVQIQCAQCHDHKTEKWKQTDFQKFAACFMRAQTLPVGDVRNMKGIRTVRVRDIRRPLPRFVKNPDLVDMARATPTTLDGTVLEGNVRQGVAAWITKNPWLSQEIVNRMWAHFLGRGFVNPVDDLRPSNPAVMGDLMNALAKDFTTHGYDLHRLIRIIAGTQAYGLSAAPPPGAPVKDDGRVIPLWSRFKITPLGPEELANALVGAAGVEGVLSRMTRSDAADVRVRLTQLFSFVFDVDEEIDQPRFEGTITQAMLLLNGKLTVGGSSALPPTALGHIVRSGEPGPEMVTNLYLRTLSRPPTKEELAAAMEYVASAPPPGRPPEAAPAEKGKGAGKGKGRGFGRGPDPTRRLRAIPRARNPRVAALEDVFWALLNSSEFVFNH